ncbi:MAG: SDR family oxidoreductase [Pseudomonadota bacterium]
MTITNTEYTLITGPTSGIGLALAEAFAARGDALFIVARRAGALEEVAQSLRTKFNVEVKTHLCDLSDATQVERLIDALQDIPLRLLVNNAGFATSGALVDLPWSGEAQQLQVNVVSLSRLCHGLGALMAKRGQGQILNVSSVSGFMPGPWMSTYAAGKAYVLNFSEGLREELAPRGVKVSVLCPGTTRSPFFEKAQIDIDKAAPAALVMTPKRVAQLTLQGLDRNDAIIVPRWTNKLMAFSPRLVPRGLLRHIVGKLYRSVAPPT